MFSLLNCVISTISYPYFMIAGIGKTEFWLMVLYETIFFVEIVINFIKQDLDDEGFTKYELPEIIAVRYI